MSVETSTPADRGQQRDGDFPAPDGAQVDVHRAGEHQEAQHAVDDGVGIVEPREQRLGVRARRRPDAADDESGQTDAGSSHRHPQRAAQAEQQLVGKGHQCGERSQNGEDLKAGHAPSSRDEKRRQTWRHDGGV